ncbi:glycosyltransferase [Desulfoglaeba alkanexedens]|uniref:Glycosyltransferase n=1 Tax=Desulfoglaeba alkanexedens ALDC TaxID=980445 RepID=A0A4P8L4V8_9BACT|nr:glycosyltransferase [Desulfoglaeba alkanexedens]QCQ22763.1 glycosyltransferase [Desulfoglaeba alkanexedens ALDC]
MPRIALYLPNFAGGGRERVMLHLAEGFLAGGYSVDLVVNRAEGAYLGRVPQRADVVELKRHNVILGRLLALRATSPKGWRALARPVLFSRKPSGELRYLGSLVRYLRTYHPAGLIAAGPYCNLNAVWARRLVQVCTRVMLTAHNTLSRMIADKGRKGAKWRELPFLIGCIYRQADAIVAVSQGVADDLSSTAGLPRERITTIYNPVVTPELAALPAAPAPHPWLEDGGPPVIVAAGRLVPQKNFPLLIEAFARLRRRRLARLLILGEGEQRGELEALASQLSIAADVALPGFVANPYAAFARAALFVLSSDYEGLGNVVIEALACGCPVVSTDCPSGPAEILDNGRYGELVPVGDAAALSAAMARALDAPPPRELLRRRGDDFTLEDGARRYLDLLLPGRGTSTHE